LRVSLRFSKSHVRRQVAPHLIVVTRTTELQVI